MNTLEKLYDIALCENISIDNFHWCDTKARIFKIDGKYSIALDNSQINNSIEEKEIMAEELGHYYCNALYTIFSPLELIKKHELRALKWAYSILVPYNKLKEKIHEGLNLYELAEKFDVEPQYMKDCIEFYIGKYGDF